MQNYSIFGLFYNKESDGMKFQASKSRQSICSWEGNFVLQQMLKVFWTWISASDKHEQRDELELEPWSIWSEDFKLFL